MFLIFIVLLLTVSQVSADFLIVNTTILHNAIGKGAVCLDGSAPAYLIDRGSGYGVNNWLVHIEVRVKLFIFFVSLELNIYADSVKIFREGVGVLRSQSASNVLVPDFFNWNRVKVKYCDGASFTGDVQEVDPVTGLHFRGARVFLAIMEDLLYKGMWKAENAILSGTSAGGLTAILHCDKFRSFFSPSARVKCISDAGFFVNMLLLKQLVSGSLLRVLDSKKYLVLILVEDFAKARKLERMFIFYEYFCWFL
ncbi:pectin acetylesterase 8-like [Nicotiana tabacum]|uniref:Pectin acetylesterase 8-like n=1 Tax=Nicotiana tabacum TaxID=4097 RepID=A0AC58SRA8_TOBAC